MTTDEMTKRIRALEAELELARLALSQIKGGIPSVDAEMIASMALSGMTPHETKADVLTRLKGIDVDHRVEAYAYALALPDDQKQGLYDLIADVVETKP